MTITARTTSPTGTSPLRDRPAVRHFLEGPALAPADLSMVLLVTELPADSPMPTVTVGRIPEVMHEAARLGIRSVKIFAESAERDHTGESSLKPDSLMVRAISTAKQAEPAIAVMTETCLCSYTDAGLCYLTDRDGHPDVPATVDVTARQAIVHATAGADIVGPASMVLGTTRGARSALDECGYASVSVMPHVIFHSTLYDGFRLTMGATPKAGVDREFQINPSMRTQFIDAALRLVRDGADMLLLEPALFCTDVLVALKKRALVPLAPFSVSGEYTSLSHLDPDTGKRDVRTLVELFTMLKRSGADACVTYAALEIARQLNG